jgi:hypothetical protein
VGAGTQFTVRLPTAPIPLAEPALGTGAGRVLATVP